MKRMLLLILTAAVGALYAQSVEAPYEVGAWLGFRDAAVTHTFDDNDLNQLAVAVPMFNEFGFKLTLFTLTGTGTGWRDPNWEGLQQAAAQGHEIASHTVTHPNFGDISLEAQQSELEDSYNAIASNISTQTWQTLAYPYCVKGNDSLVSQYYIGARGCSGSVERTTPRDMLNISSIICGTEGAVKTATNFNSKADYAVGRNGWCVFLIHGIDDDGGWSPVESAELRAHLEYLSANPGQFWVATFGDAIRYIRERDGVSVTETASEDTVLTVQVTDTLDNAVYDHPVTVRRPVPDGWPSAIASQNGELVNSRVIEERDTLYVMFDVIPDGGDIQIIRSTDTGVRTSGRTVRTGPVLSQNYPNPFNPETKIRFQIEESTRVEAKILNARGQEIVRLTDRIYPAGRHTLEWDGRDRNGKPVPSGVYFYQLLSDRFSEVRRMTLVR